MTASRKYLGAAGDNPPHDLPDRDGRDTRLGAMRDALRTRLRPVTQNLPSDDVEALVSDMAALQDKYEQLKLERSYAETFRTGPSPTEPVWWSTGR